jgi:hypothetical protein
VAKPPAPAPKPPSVSAATPATDDRGVDLMSKLRSDWNAVRRAFDAAGDDMKSAVRPRHD